MEFISYKAGHCSLCIPPGPHPAFSKYDVRIIVLLHFSMSHLGVRGIAPLKLPLSRRGLSRMDQDYKWDRPGRGNDLARVRDQDTGGASPIQIDSNIQVQI